MKIKPIKEYEANYQPVVKSKTKTLKKATVLLSASMLAATQAGCIVSTSGMMANDTPEPTAYNMQDDGDNTVYTMGEISIDTPEPTEEPDKVLLMGDVAFETPEPDEPVVLDGAVKAEEP